MFRELDPLLHSQLRLSVMSILISVKEADFVFLKEKTQATAGNLSVQLKKLADAGYIKMSKQFKDNYPLTTLAWENAPKRWYFQSDGEIPATHSTDAGTCYLL